MLAQTLSDIQDKLEDLQKSSSEEHVIPYQDKEEKKAIDIQNFIMKCESNENPKAVNLNDKKITGYISAGLFQFQLPTFRNAGIKYGVFPEGTTLKIAMKYIYNPAYNAAVAHGLIKDGEYQHWQICFSKYKRAEKMNLLARK